MIDVANEIKCTIYVLDLCDRCWLRNLYRSDGVILQNLDEKPREMALKNDYGRFSNHKFKYDRFTLFIHIKYILQSIQ